MVWEHAFSKARHRLICLNNFCYQDTSLTKKCCHTWPQWCSSYFFIIRDRLQLVSNLFNKQLSFPRAITHAVSWTSTEWIASTCNIHVPNTMLLPHETQRNMYIWNCKMCHKFIYMLGNPQTEWVVSVDIWVETLLCFFTDPTSSNCAARMNSFYVRVFLQPMKYVFCVWNMFNDTFLSD